MLGNRIGLGNNGAALGNGFDGVVPRASDGVIQGNQIARNPGNGVTVSGSGVRNAIRGNDIHHNGGLGIDLGGDGVTANDPGDPDSGPNDLMNYPDGIDGDLGRDLDRPSADTSTRRVRTPPRSTSSPTRSRTRPTTDRASRTSARRRPTPTETSA